MKVKHEKEEQAKADVRSAKLSRFVGKRLMKYDWNGWNMIKSIILEISCRMSSNLQKIQRQKLMIAHTFFL